MAIKPILFNTEMVRAILDGRKSCTRCLVKTRWKDVWGFCVVIRKMDGSFVGIYEYDENEIMFDNSLEPPYQPGDILYVRETWHKYTKRVGDGKNCHLAEFYGYKASVANSEDADEPWKPSIYMPKEVVRIWLKVTDVRAERLQDITSKQICKEGVEVEEPYTLNGKEERYAFASLWNSTIKKSDFDRYGWDANPWVWVIKFVKIDKPEEI